MIPPDRRRAYRAAQRRFSRIDDQIIRAAKPAVGKSCIRFGESWFCFPTDDLMREWSRMRRAGNRLWARLKRTAVERAAGIG